MSETLGSLCDKLTVVKLKQFHSVNKLILGSLEVQEQQLKEEIDEFIYCAVNGEIHLGKLAYA